MAAVTAGGGEVEECPPRLVVAALRNDHGRTGIEQVTHQIRGLVVGRVDAPRDLGSLSSVTEEMIPCPGGGVPMAGEPHEVSGRAPSRAGRRRRGRHPFALRRSVPHRSRSSAVQHSELAPR